MHLEDFQVIQRIHHVRTGIPERIVGAHFCFQNQWCHRPFVTGIQLFLNSAARPRVRTHSFHKVSEIRFRLQTFGIDTSCCPLEEDGGWAVPMHLEWLEAQRRAEEKFHTAEVVATEEKLNDVPYGEAAILLPRRFDVLFGTHKSIRQHTGNLRALHLVEMYWSQYEAANKYEKTEVADRIVKVIHDSQGRFLKWDDGEWIQVDHDIAREKISHYFRYMRAKVRARKSERHEENGAGKEKRCISTLSSGSGLLGQPQT